MRCQPDGSFRLLMSDASRREIQPLHYPVDFKRASSSIYGPHEQWELFSFSRGLDLLHSPHFNVPVLGAKKMVVTVHDLIYLKDARFSGSRFTQTYVNYMFNVIEKRADAVLTVSEFTKNDLLERFPKLHGRVFVTPEAASFHFQPVRSEDELAAAKKKLQCPKPFVLFVGSLKKHKNVALLIEAMAALRERSGFDHELLLVGKADPRERELLELIGRHPFVRWMEGVSDDQLVFLYNLAVVFVLPSLWEGFGLPVLEAMACGTPVLVSDRASLPEVAGEAGLYFDPTRVDALKELLYTVLQDGTLRQKMSQMGLKQAKKFSWDRTAAQTLQVYERVLR